jgi:hypothetical protein
MVPTDQLDTFQNILELLYGRPGTTEGSRDQTGDMSLRKHIFRCQIGQVTVSRVRKLPAEESACPPHRSHFCFGPPGGVPDPRVISLHEVCH